MKRVFKLGCGAKLEVISIRPQGITVHVEGPEDIGTFITARADTVLSASNADIYFKWAAVPGLCKALAELNKVEPRARKGQFSYYKSIKED